MGNKRHRLPNLASLGIAFGLGSLITAGVILMSWRPMENRREPSRESRVTVHIHDNGKPVNTPWRVRNCANRVKKSDAQLGWKSQWKEDIYLMEHFFHRAACEGVFLEIGALDGVQFSNTYTLEKEFGWSGILIEASPGNARALIKNRPNVPTIWSAVCGDENPSKTIPILGGGPMSGSVQAMPKNHKQFFNPKNIVNVTCKTLSEILSGENGQRLPIKVIDVFFLDVEGAEYNVLRTMDWSVPVGLYFIEMDGNDKEKDEKVRQLLRDHGYMKTNKTGYTEWALKFRKPGSFANSEVFEHPEYSSVYSQFP